MSVRARKIFATSCCVPARAQDCLHHFRFLLHSIISTCRKAACCFKCVCLNYCHDAATH